MKIITKTIIYIAMMLLMAVSMWTTYQSLHDSILPKPSIPIHLPNGWLWDCSIFALGLSLAIGLMLFALKMSIIDGQKRLNIMGLLGLTVVGFISISFNLDVLYRTADKDFFINYSNSKMKGTYEDYLSKAQAILTEKKETILKQVAKQEGELDAEVRGLRQKPAGYGEKARQEDYQLTLLQKTTNIELQTVENALAKKEEADTLLTSSTPQTIPETEQLQHQLRVILKDISATSGITMPEIVKFENPLFVVFAKLFDWHTVGIKEIFFVIVAFFLDLGDIIGYSMIPNKKRETDNKPKEHPQLKTPEIILPTPIMPLPASEAPLELAQTIDLTETDPLPATPSLTNTANDTPYPLRRTRKPFGFRR